MVDNVVGASFVGGLIALVALSILVPLFLEVRKTFRLKRVSPWGFILLIPVLLIILNVAFPWTGNASYFLAAFVVSGIAALILYVVSTRLRPRRD